jgi:hypothetical protein
MIMIIIIKLVWEYERSSVGHPLLNKLFNIICVVIYNSGYSLQKGSDDCVRTQNYWDIGLC